MIIDPLELGLILVGTTGLGALLALVFERSRAKRTPEAKTPPFVQLDEAAFRGQLEARVQALEQEADQRARRTLLAAIERVAVPVTAESVQAVVPLASEDLKGRIIGREGRNLRSFEQVAGVELLVEEGSPSVAISCLDPVRREIARRTLEALLEEGKIQPARIEETHGRTRAAFERELPDIGREAARRAGVGGLPPSTLKVLGALRYRSSASQNVLEHSIECADLAARLAAEVGADPDVARRAALLHDLGKALGEEWPGPHAVAGAAFLRSAGESDRVCHAVEAHHSDVEPKTAEAAVVRIADAVSSSRPGARKQDLEAFLERIAALEAVARAEPGVQDAYALRAGRELRVVVEPDAVGEREAEGLARRVAALLGDQPEFRGPVDVVVVRETRHRAIADGEVP
ncbi:MAG: HD domain-containing protein [Fimbriimonadaceae bacterium]|nr:HD domain-containing protein [Chthonomonadaceae bacterium]MCO5296118.1 HD domain-containing protein [Fimbriimonadaceae bacterium]